MKTLTKFVIFCIAMIIIYIITAIVFQSTTELCLPDALTVGVFGFFGTELCATAFIQWMKIKYEDNKEEKIEY